MDININQLPQIVIDKYLSYTKRDEKIKSIWDKSFEIISIRTNPYWKILFKDDENYYKIFYDTISEPKFKKVFQRDKKTRKIKINNIPIKTENFKILEVFNLAIKENFFNDITIVKNFIKDGDTYVGYVYPKCEKTDINMDSKEFKGLYEKLCKNVKTTKIIYTDLYYSNIVKYNNKLYLIDLDSLLKLEKNNLNKFCKRYDTLPFYYKNFIIQLFYRLNT